MPDEPIIHVENLHFAYNAESQNPIVALIDVNLEIGRGEYVVIVGHNGSGKSTLAKNLNALLIPTQGEVWVKGMNTREREHTLDIRRTVGMVFQIPDNQIVATVVEEDVAFGPENLGVPPDELEERVTWALGVVDMLEFRDRAPHLLSAGQKQRVAIAGAMAMHPEVLVLDESTAMLDPVGRREVLDAVRRLNDDGMTIVAITHFMHEAVEADRVLVMEAGQIVMQGTPRQVFGRVEELRALQLDVPQPTELAYALHRRRVDIPPDLLTVNEVVSRIEELAGQSSPGRRGLPTEAGMGSPDRRGLTEAGAGSPDRRGLTEVGAGSPDRRGLTEVGAGSPDRRGLLTEAGPSPIEEQHPIIEIDDLHHTYLRGSPLEVEALKGVNLCIYRGESVGIIGRTGAGKSSVVQHLNGLIRPRERGKVIVDGMDLADSKVDVKRLRQKVGLVFQYPDHQLFERLVGDDIAFGPKKMGMAPQERRQRVRWAMEMVGLDFERFKDRFTFSLSGGEMRKAAMAGVLALRPEVLILDESTSGLDPRGRKELLERIMALHRDEGLTIIFVSPNMEDMAGLVQRIYVVADGRTVMEGTTREVFSRPQELKRYGLGVPQVTEVVHTLKARGLPVERTAVTVAEAEEDVWKILNS